MEKNKNDQVITLHGDSQVDEQIKFGFYLLLFAIALIPRLLHLLMIADNPFFHFPIIDSQINDNWAGNIASGNWLGRGPFWQAPLYPYFLGIIYTILGHDLFLARIIQIILGSVNCLLLYRIARTAFNSKVALVSFLIAAFYGPFLFFENELLNPVLMIFFNLLAVLILFSFLHRPRWIKLLLTGMVLGLSTITHGLAITIVPFAVLWTIIILAKRKSSIPKILASCLVLLIGFLLVLSLTTVRNLVVGDDLVIVSSNTGINFFIGNNPDYEKTTSIRPGMEWEELLQLPMQEGLDKPSQRSAFFWKQSFNYMTTQPFSYLKLLAKKLFFILDGYEIKRNQDPYMFRAYSLPLSLLLWKLVIYFPFGLLLPLGLVGIVAFFRGRSKSEDKDFRPILIFYFLISQVLALLFFFVCSRYRLPLVPFLIVFASVGLLGLYQKIKSRRYKDFVIFTAILLVFLVISNMSSHQLTAKDFAEEHYNLGVVFARQEKFNEAMQQFQEAILQQPDHVMAHFQIALLYDKQKMFDEAEKKYLEVIDIFPRAALAYNNLGLIYQSRGDFLKAEEYYIKANDAHSLLPEPLYNLANTFLDQRQYSLAKEKLVACLFLDPYYYKAYNSLGDLNYRTGNLDEAIRNFENAIRYNPDYAVAHNNLGSAYMKKGQRQLAFMEFETAVELDSSYGSAHANLGNWYLEDRNPEKAIPFYRRATELLPNDPMVRYNLAMAYGFTGRESDAITELYRALDADSTFQPARELLQKVTAPAEQK